MSSVSCFPVSERKGGFTPCQSDVIAALRDRFDIESSAIPVSGGDPAFWDFLTEVGHLHHFELCVTRIADDHPMNHIEVVNPELSELDAIESYGGAFMSIVSSTVPFSRQIKNTRFYMARNADIPRRDNKWGVHIFLYIITMLLSFTLSFISLGRRLAYLIPGGSAPKVSTLNSWLHDLISDTKKIVLPHAYPKIAFGGEPTCLFDSMCQLYGRTYVIFALGIAPRDSTVKTLLRVKDHRISKLGLPLHFRLPTNSARGHVATEHFTGSKFWLPLTYVKRIPFFDNPLKGRIKSGAASLSDSFASPMIPALGGVRATLSQLPVTAVSSNINERWYPTRFPRQMTNTALNWNFQHPLHSARIFRKNDYLRSFPEASTRARLPSLFSDDLPSVMLFRPQPGRDHYVQASYTRRWDITHPVRTLSNAYVNLAKVLDGDSSRDALAAADQVVAVDRFLDTRGNRQVEKWEADQWPRWLALASFVSWSQGSQCYREAAYRLLSRYFTTRTYDELIGKLPGVILEAGNPGLNVQVTYINSVPVVGPGAINPEGPMWTDAAQSGLRNGTKQFIDGQGLSAMEIAEFITALAPLDDNDQIPRILGNIHGIVGAQLIPPHGRYLYPNGVDEIFVHMGNNPIPDAATQAAIAGQVHGIPEATRIGSILRLIASRHGGAGDIQTALEMLMYRGVGYFSNDVKNRRNNYRPGMVVHCDGHYEMHSIRNYTASAYLDSLRKPEPIPQWFQEFIATPTEELLNNLVLASHARATALAWASFALSMVGRTWRATPGNELNQHVANHIDVWLRTYNNENLDLWATVHANAMAFQYGFAPSPISRSTEALRVYHIWNTHQTPILTNHYHELWMMDLMPSHELLPYSDAEGTSHPTWDESSPSPVSDYASFQGDVQLGRDLAPFTGRTWLGDGGYTHNAQFYAAQGVNDAFRYEGQTQGFRLARWQHQMVHQFPQNPSSEAPVWMDVAGTPFSDFILPGSLPSMLLTRNRTFAWGVRLQEKTTPRTDPIWQRWHRLGLKEARQSLMVNYVHPLRSQREIEALEDYSVLIWEEGNRFAGMTLVRGDLPNGSADLRFDESNIPLIKGLGLPEARGSPGTNLSQPRVTARRGLGRDDTLGRITAFMEPRPANTRHEAEPNVALSYEPPYPATTTELPKMNTYQGAMNEQGISLQPITDPAKMPPSDDAIALLNRLNAIEREADDDQREWQAIEQEKAVARRSLYAAQQERIADRVKQRATSEPRGRRPGSRRYNPPATNVATKVAGPGSVQVPYTANRPLSAHEARGVVVPNDGPAAAAQNNLNAIQRDLQQTVDMANRPTPPRITKGKAPRDGLTQMGGETGEPSSYQLANEAISSRIEFEKGMANSNGHANRFDGDVLTRTFEEVEGLRDPENSSGAQ